MSSDTYDFIVIGGGTAGLVLANRLTENAQIQVLVLEAGEDLTADSRVITPALFPTLIGSDADWNTVTEAQSALGNRKINIPHGRLLGGSSAINGQAFVATSKINVDTWGSLGNPEWSWEKLEPYFKKTYTFAPPSSDDPTFKHLHLDYIEPHVGGTDGPIQASFPSGTDNPLPKAWIESLQSLGHKATGDPFSGEIIDDLLRQDPTALEKAMDQYATSKSGPLAAGGIFSYAFLGLQDTPPKLTSDISYAADTHPLKSAQTEYYKQLLENPGESTAGFFTYAAQGNFGSDSGSSLMQSGFLPGNYYPVAICLLQPLSRGYVHIRSADPLALVRVDPRYLTHPLDLEVFARHMTYISKIVSTEPLATLLKANGRRNATAPPDIADVEAMKAYLKRTTMSSWHPTSTCAMLPLDKGGVVNERFVVHGTRNLRVVDASVFPITTRGNPMATVYAVAERAADFIKEDLEARSVTQA